MRKASLAAIALLVAGGAIIAGVTLYAHTGQAIARPAGSEAAFRAFSTALPGAKLIAVEAPKDFGLDSADGKPLFWTFRYELNGLTAEVPIAPSGLVLRLKQRIGHSDLPAAVASALAREANGAKVTSMDREEIRATLKFVGIPKPRKYYVIGARQNGKDHQLVVQQDGKVSSSRAVTAGGEGTEKDEESAGTPKSPPKEISIPTEQGAAVNGVKAAYPGAVVVAVEEVGYDDGSGQMSVLYYEVEFPWHGRVKEAHATPEGLLLDQDRFIAPTDLPQVIRDAVEAKLPNATIGKATAMEDRAGPMFVALSRPKHVYILGLEKNGKSSTLHLTPDGSKIKAFRPTASD